MDFNHQVHIPYASSAEGSGFVLSNTEQHLDDGFPCTQNITCFEFDDPYRTFPDPLW